MYRENTSGLHIVELEVTNRCNLSCEHCYVDTAVACDVPSEKAFSLIEESDRLGINRFVITGGEPLLYEGIYAVASFARRCGIPEVNLQTNGTLIHEFDAKEMRVFNVVQLSLDMSVSDVTRARTDYLVQMREKIELLRSYGISVFLFATIYKSALPLMKEMVRFANSLGVRLGFNKFVPIRGDDFSQEQSLSLSERRAMLELFIECEAAGYSVKCSDPNMFLLDEARREALERDEEKGLIGGCTAGIAALYVTSSGDVLPCPFVRVVCGNINNDSLEKVWNGSPILRKLRNRDGYLGICGACRYNRFCGGCRAASLIQYGDPFHSDPNCLLLGGKS